MRHHQADGGLRGSAIARYQSRTRKIGGEGKTWTRNRRETDRRYRARSTCREALGVHLWTKHLGWGRRSYGHRLGARRHIAGATVEHRRRWGRRFGVIGLAFMEIQAVYVLAGFDTGVLFSVLRLLSLVGFLSLAVGVTILFSKPIGDE